MTAKKHADGTAHHYLVDNPETSSGGLVGASCLRCGATRTYAVSQPDDDSRAWRGYRRYPTETIRAEVVG